ncbi:MAG TPA: cupin domain-containing protein [Holophagaceae bacterium]|jgi:quercetin dioxygenase-like cupin family protein|nr:cupin domain-containing protein [Holophagaceae bacterium]
MRLALLLALGSSLFAGSPPRVRLVAAHSLPPLNRANLSMKILEVHYGPGESSEPHRHPFPVMVYVLEGAIRSQVEGQPEARLYQAGESFYEAPDVTHLVSANASATEPARFLAIFTCDHEAELSSALPGGKP